METENGPLEDYFPLRPMSFQGSMWVSSRVYYGRVGLCGPKGPPGVFLVAPSKKRGSEPFDCPATIYIYLRKNHRTVPSAPNHKHWNLKCPNTTK